MLRINGNEKQIQTRKNKLPNINNSKNRVNNTQSIPKVNKNVTNKTNSKANHKATTKVTTVNARSSKQPKKDITKQGEKVILQPITLLEKIQSKLKQPPDSNCGQVLVRYNHYKKYFNVHNSIIKYSDIDEEYCLSFVFKGNYKRYLVLLNGDNTNHIIYNNNSNDKNDEIDNNNIQYIAQHDENYNYFMYVADGNEYRLEVVEDPDAGIGAEGLRISNVPLNANSLSGISNSGNRNVQLITEELKKLNASELNSNAAKDLIERRDIEDILYS